MLDEREIAPNIAGLASQIGDPARAAMLWSLMGGQTRPAGELARIAGMSPQAASPHLLRLAEGGLLTVEVRGRNRLYRLTGPETAAAIEALAALATIADHGTQVVSLVPKPLRHARSCWGHLAGVVGVELHDALIARGWFESHGSGYAVTPSGSEGFYALGIRIAGLRPGRRGLAFPCLDWSERRPHLGGPLARALLDRFIDGGWLARSSKGRGLTLTPLGKRQLDALSVAGFAKSEAAI